MTEFTAVTEPLHVGNFPDTCADCHAEASWAPATNFDHARFFELDGAHALVRCSQCHGGGFKSGDTPSDCVGCHRQDYEQSTFPGHEKFGTQCSDCHDTTAWKPARIADHDQFFKLDGQHTTVACASCHTMGYAAGQTPKDCVGCHRKDYDTSPFPNHNTFPTTCTDCHTTSGWKPAMLPNHDQFFKLDGQHTTVACASCHTMGYAAGQTPKECVGCHRKDYDSSPFPNHNTFPTTCTDCHTTSGWKPAMLPNHDQFFKLDGQHTTVACASCHTMGYAAGQTPKDCVGCHRKDYDTSPYPGHSAFPTTCADCHQTSGWTPASGAHPESKFPITSGSHRGIACMDCHNASLGAMNDKANTDCVGCHSGTHARSRMDSKHREVSKYPTGAAPGNFCLNCHPDGRNRN